eukprot:5297725-Pleurochrysis_carterae.AAC.4
MCGIATGNPSLRQWRLLFEHAYARVLYGLMTMHRKLRWPQQKVVSELGRLTCSEAVLKAKLHGVRGTSNKQPRRRGAARAGRTRA